jgi:membrane protease YdiL (CAAX protease family)
MSRERDRSHPTDAFGLPEGLLAALVCALLLVGVFAIASSATPMPPAERWAALTTFTLLALGATLPGCAALYDALGRAVRRDWRALVALAALVPALYLAYALAVRELSAAGLGAAVLFAAVPALAFAAARGSRTPTPLDAVALGYLLVSLALGLLPRLTLPQQGGQVSFFQLAAVPLLLLLYAWRGWPGLGFTWHLSWRELRDALLTALAALAPLLLIGLAMGFAEAPQSAAAPPNPLVAAVGAYFFAALPAELLLRGGAQNGLERALRGPMGSTASWVALAVAAALSGLAGYAQAGGDLRGLVVGALLGLAAGWVYRRTGKVTASTVTHTLVVWALTMMAAGVPGLL